MLTDDELEDIRDELVAAFGSGLTTWFASQPHLDRTLAQWKKTLAYCEHGDVMNVIQRFVSEEGLRPNGFSFIPARIAKLCRQSESVRSSGVTIGISPCEACESSGLLSVFTAEAHKATIEGDYYRAKYKSCTTACHCLWGERIHRSWRNPLPKFDDKKHVEYGGGCEDDVNRLCEFLGVPSQWVPAERRWNHVENKRETVEATFIDNAAVLRRVLPDPIVIVDEKPKMRKLPDHLKGVLK